MSSDFSASTMDGLLAIRHAFRQALPKLMDSARYCSPETKQRAIALEDRVAYYATIPAQEVLDRLNNSYEDACNFYRMVECDGMLGYSACVMVYLQGLKPNAAECIPPEILAKDSTLYGIHPDYYLRYIADLRYAQFIIEADNAINARMFFHFMKDAMPSSTLLFIPDRMQMLQDINLLVDRTFTPFEQLKGETNYLRCKEKLSVTLAPSIAKMFAGTPCGRQTMREIIAARNKHLKDPEPEYNDECFVAGSSSRITRSKMQKTSEETKIRDDMTVMDNDADLDELSAEEEVMTSDEDGDDIFFATQTTVSEIA